MNSNSKKPGREFYAKAVQPLVLPVIIASLLVCIACGGGATSPAPTTAAAPTAVASPSPAPSPSPSPSPAPSPTPPPPAPKSNSSTLQNLQASSGWVGYGEFPPAYNICTSCGSGISWSMGQGVKSPSLSNNATQFNIGGTNPYADVLWTNALIGQKSSQNLPDSNHTLIPSLQNFTYEVDFYSNDLSVSQVLEFDINEYFNGMGLIFGTQCRIAGGQMWDIWDNVNHRWVSTGVACNPQNGTWNHLSIEVQRQLDNSLLYKSITLNGFTADINQSYPHGDAPSGWWGITTNFQMDGNRNQAPYSVWLDNFSFTYN